MLFSILLIALTGCSEEPAPTNGNIDACLGGPSAAAGGEDLEVEISGTVTAIDGESPDMNLVGCAEAPSHTIEITDEAGDVWTVGLNITTEDTDRTPTFAVAEGDVIDLTFREKLVWGTVAGFTLANEEGLIAAVEQGTWGGALNVDDTPGLEVSGGSDVINTEDTDCMPIETFSVIFSADTELELDPDNIETLELDGATYSAFAVASYDYGSGTNCQVSDSTGATAWAVYR